MILYSILLGISQGLSFDDSEKDYTIVVNAGKRDCYFETFKKDMSFEIEYQVVDGGDLDINFEIISPAGKVMISDRRQEDGLHNIQTEGGGDFQFCFDNSFSRMTNKVVFFEIFLDIDYDDYDPDDYDDDYRKEIEDAVEKDDTDYDQAGIKGLTSSLGKIKVNQGKTLQYQAMLRAFEAKDRNLIEMNYNRVNFWSMVHMCVMIGTAVLQVNLYDIMQYKPCLETTSLTKR